MNRQKGRSVPGYLKTKEAIDFIGLPQNSSSSKLLATRITPLKFGGTDEKPAQQYWAIEDLEACKSFLLKQRERNIQKARAILKTKKSEEVNGSFFVPEKLERKDVDALMDLLSTMQKEIDALKKSVEAHTLELIGLTSGWKPGSKT